MIFYSNQKPHVVTGECQQVVSFGFAVALTALPVLNVSDVLTAFATCREVFQQVTGSSLYQFIISILG